MNKKEKLETLLNSLIARGRSPRNKEKVALISIVGDQLRLLEADLSIYTPYSPRLRELVSLESGLWDTVVKNKLYDDTGFYRAVDYMRDHCNRQSPEYRISTPSYRLVKSALITEKELAQFLLDNIIL